jgi:chromosome partitioning protein
LARSALLAAERVLIPVQPSPYDLWASAEMVALIREAQVFRPALRAAFVINRRVSTTVIGREARGAGRPAASRAARGSASAHRVRRQRGRWPACTRDGARQRRRPRNHRAGGRTAAVADMTAKPPPNSKRTAKRVGIGARPPANPHAEAWIRQGDADALGKGDLYTPA